MNKLSCPICHGTFQHKEGCQNADYAYKLRERIEELEAELYANQQSWQEHDQGRIFAAKEMQLRIEELEEAMRAGCEDMQKVLNNRLTFSSKCL